MVYNLGDKYKKSFILIEAMGKGNIVGWLRHIFTHKEVKRTGKEIIPFFEKSLLSLLSMILLATLLLAYMPKNLFTGILGNSVISSFLGSIIGLVLPGTTVGGIILLGEVAPAGLTTGLVASILLSWNGLYLQQSTWREKGIIIGTIILFSFITALVMSTVLGVMGW
jgi:hypothetical protein